MDVGQFAAKVSTLQARVNETFITTNHSISSEAGKIAVLNETSSQVRDLLAVPDKLAFDSSTSKKLEALVHRLFGIIDEWDESSADGEERRVQRGAEAANEHEQSDSPLITRQQALANLSSLLTELQYAKNDRHAATARTMLDAGVPHARPELAEATGRVGVTIGSALSKTSDGPNPSDYRRHGFAALFNANLAPERSNLSMAELIDVGYDLEKIIHQDSKVDEDTLAEIARFRDRAVSEQEMTTSHKGGEAQHGFGKGIYRDKLEAVVELANTILE